MRPLAAITVSALLVLAAASCKPTYEPKGELSIDGLPFRPTVCHVLTRATGIELVDHAGTRLELTLPPATLHPFTEMPGTPQATLTITGKPPALLGPCGSLTLRGEGYHEPSRRAAGGTMALSCSGAGAGAPTVKGELSFSGCF